VVKNEIAYLRVYREQPADVPPRKPEEAITSLTEVLAAFREATGWPLERIPGPKSNRRASLTWSTPANPGDGTTPGHLSLGRAG